MRLLVSCPSGESRLLQVNGDSSVAEIKQLLEEQEGIPCTQQVLCFAGQHLQDHLTLNDYCLVEFTLSAEVVLYLSQRLASPKRIFLTCPAKPSQLVAELVEADMPVGEVLGLLASRGLGSTGDCPERPVLVKRQDGSTVPLAVNAAEGLARLEARITQQEGVAPTTLTFWQAQDSSLHCSIWPSAEASKQTYPVYQRNVAPQATMPKCTAGPGRQPLNSLAKELCVQGDTTLGLNKAVQTSWHGTPPGVA